MTKFIEHRFFDQRSCKAIRYKLQNLICCLREQLVLLLLISVGICFPFMWDYEIRLA